MGRPTKKQLQSEAVDQEIAKRRLIKEEVWANYREPALIAEASFDSVPVRARLDLATGGVPALGYNALNGIRSPFHSSRYGWDVEEAVRMCEGAYWSFPLLKNVVDVMGELSNSELYLKGGNKKTRDFITSWIKQIKFPKFAEAFFREYFRSGNLIIYRTDADYNENDLRKMNQVFGASVKTQIPIRYTILNPTQIRVRVNINQAYPIYAKILDAFEVQRVLNPQTDEDRAFAATFDPKIIAEMKNGVIPTVPLDPEYLSEVFYKKQPYEPLAVPMAYPLLADINDKLEMKKKDAEFVKKMDNALLLVNVGQALDEYNTVSTSAKTMEFLQKFFTNTTVARVLVTDHTVKAEWKIPDLTKVMGMQKYAQIDQDLAVGLNAILFNSDEKFSNTSIKVQVFIERLNEARKAFLGFFQDEVKRVCGNIGAQTYPEVYFEEISLKDEVAWARIYTQLATIGFFTPKETFEAIETGKIPSVDESVENQTDFYNQRKENLYFPQIGGNNALGLPTGAAVVPPVPTPAASSPIQVKKPATGKPKGRPAGSSGTPKSTASLDPNQINYSTSKLIYYTSKAHKLIDSVGKSLRKKHSLARLSKEQKEVAQEIAASIIANELEPQWKLKVSEYIDNLKEIDPNQLIKIRSLAQSFELDNFQALLLSLAEE